MSDMAIRAQIGVGRTGVGDHQL